MAVPEPALVVDDLVVRYPGAGSPAVDHASWRAHAGEITTLLGPNGAGKTSTVECCVGLRRTSEGRIVALGRTGASAQTPAHRAELGVMLQDGGLPTGSRPLALLRHLAGLYTAPADVDQLAERLGLTSFSRTGIRRLSGGQRQRVALAAALVGRPRLLFLDEPTAGLDPQSKVVVREVLSEQCAAGVAVVLTTHDLDEAARVAHRVVVMNQGRVVADDSPAVLTDGLPRTLVVRLPAGVNGAGLVDAVPALRESSPGQFSVSGVDVGPAMLAAAGEWCARAGLTGADVQLRPPSLEDVVLALTSAAGGQL